MSIVNKRHKWSHPHTAQGQCVKCGMIRDYFRGGFVYERDEKVFSEYQPCDERILKGFKFNHETPHLEKF